MNERKSDSLIVFFKHSLTAQKFYANLFVYNTRIYNMKPQHYIYSHVIVNIKQILNNLILVHNFKAKH